jgi:hypothetical protein
MAQGYNKFYDHNKQKEEKKEKEIKRNMEGDTSCPECGCGNFKLKIIKGTGGLMERQCSKGHSLEAVR